METLSYGFKKPATGDPGSTFFEAMEDNVQQMNDHTHNGDDSAPIPTSSLEKSTATISSGSWSATSGGRYRQEITLPDGFTFASTHFKFTTSGNVIIFPTIEQGSTTSKYYVYVNDNTLTLTASYV